MYDSFKGTFDGNGYTITIKDSYINSSYYYRGLFSNIGSGGIVKNLNVIGYLANNMKNSSYIGGIAGRNVGGTITNCSANVNINASGVLDGSPRSCTVGGIVGYNTGTISYCFSNGNITGPSYNSGTGGIVGNNGDSEARIENCVYTGEISKYYGSTDTKYGMVCGYASNVSYYQYITNCYYISRNGLTGIGSYSSSSAIDDAEHCTPLSQFQIRDLAKAGGEYASNINQVFLNGILSFPFNLDFKASDGIDYFNSLKGEPANIIFRRVAQKDKKCTICMPFNVPQAQADNVGKFYMFTGLKTGTSDVIQMTQVTAGGLQANTAYIFEPKSGYNEDPNYSGIQFGNVVIANSLTPVVESGTIQFIGTYDEKVWNTGDSDLGQVYGFAISGYESEGFTAGQFVKLGAGASAAPFRAYLKYTGGSLLGASARTRGLSGLPDVLKIEWISSNGATTGINNIEISPKDEWYNIMGHKLNYRPVTKGIYIHNGKKVIIR